MYTWNLDAMYSISKTISRLADYTFWETLTKDRHKPLAVVCWYQIGIKKNIFGYWYLRSAQHDRDF